MNLHVFRTYVYSDKQLVKNILFRLTYNHFNVVKFGQAVSQ